ncbi:3066_t:CDS:1 [Funneliformis mosseae]|uniref:3066_t:CDS:1 n=1 Tax=Funneliformis mosseae TaxID=27381 RepID=A0A9N9C7U9_FUNMO|nr:3066_t:CDS:1 [Funneliformis mosseae]
MSDCTFYTYQPGKPVKEKRHPNMFFLYRKDMMRYRPYNISMSEFSKTVSEKWKELSEDQKIRWQRKYHERRDKKLQIAVSNSPIEVISEIQTAAAIPNSVNNDLTSIMKGDCFLTEGPPEDFLFQ